jgi:hypothetical protein
MAHVQEARGSSGSTYDTRSSRDGDAEDAEVLGQAGTQRRRVKDVGDAKAPETACRGDEDFSPA